MKDLPQELIPIFNAGQACGFASMYLFMVVFAVCGLEAVKPCWLILLLAWPVHLMAEWFSFTL